MALSLLLSLLLLRDQAELTSLVPITFGVAYDFTAEAADERYLSGRPGYQRGLPVLIADRSASGDIELRTQQLELLPRSAGGACATDMSEVVSDGYAGEVLPSRLCPSDSGSVFAAISPQSHRNLAPISPPSRPHLAPITPISPQSPRAGTPVLFGESSAAACYTSYQTIEDIEESCDGASPQVAAPPNDHLGECLGEYLGE